MSCKFTFDLSKIPKELFEETEDFVKKVSTKRKNDAFIKNMVKKYKIDEIGDLSIKDAISIMKDIYEIQKSNQRLRNFFIKSNDRAVFLPHCCRKHMDSNCKAIFEPSTSTYSCVHCSADCMVNKATYYAKKEGYDVYILPGASCLNKIFNQKKYTGIVGIACTDEIKLAAKSLLKMRIPTQAIPLLKNGCAGTLFSLESLINVLQDNSKLPNKSIISND